MGCWAIVLLRKMSFGSSGTLKFGIEPWKGLVMADVADL